jgi:hypothetical protein
MPNPAKPKSRSTKKPRAAALRAKAPVKRAGRRMLNGIPLKRKVIWTYDTDSPEFKAARDRDKEAAKSKDWDRDGMQWAEAVTSDPDWQRMWK